MENKSKYIVYSEDNDYQNIFYVYKRERESKAEADIYDYQATR